MIYELKSSRYVLLDEEIKKLAKFIKEEFGIDRVYRIEGDYQEVGIYAYDNREIMG